MGLAVDLDQHQELYLERFQITGNWTLPTRLLLQELTLERPRFPYWRRPPRFSPADLQGDIENLLALYRRHGFYHTRITPAILVVDKLVTVRLQIEEGPFLTVETVDLKVVGPPLPRPPRYYLDQGPLQVGQRFTERAFDDLKKLLLNDLLDHGHPRARVEGEVLVDPQANTAAVYLQVLPGPLCTFGPVTIRGQQETPAALIRRQLRFRPGEKFSLAKLLASQEKLYGLDLFQSVVLEPAEVPPEVTAIPIRVEVQEKKKRSLKLGVGYGTWDEFRGRAVVAYRNLGGGGRYLEGGAKYSRLEQRYEGSFTNPLPLDLDLVATSGFLRRYYPTFSDRAYFLRPLLTRELFPGLKGQLGYGLEFARPYNLPESTLRLLAATRSGQLYRLQLLVAGLTWDTTDNPIDPQRGHQLSLLAEWAPELLSGQLQFLQAVMELRKYQQLGSRDLVLAGRLRFGLIQPLEETSQIPIVRRLFSGGPDTLRSYRYYYLGPRDQGGNPLGGESLLLANLELRFPIYKDLQGAAFLEAGNVFYKLHQTDLGQLKYGAGCGLRYRTPIGPLGLDLAWPLNPIDRRTDKYQVIFNIGQPF